MRKSTNLICFINTAKIWGGGENWQYETMLDLREELHLVSISNPQGKLYNFAAEAGIETYPFQSRNLSFLNPIKLFSAYRLLKKLNPHAIIFNTSNDFKVFSLPARWAGMEYRLYRRDNGKPMRSHLLNKILLRKGITHFLPCSEYIGKAALAKNSKLFPNSKIDTIYNSINIRKWDAANAPLLSIERNPGEIIFGCLGRLSSEKGQAILPPVAEMLKDKSQKFKILIAGTGPLKPELESLISKTGVANHVQLLGFVENNKSFLSAIDCLIIPSHWEGLSTVAIEAMAMSKPIIAFDVASNSEVVHDKVNGFLIKPFDIEAVVDSMLYLIKNPEEIKCFGVSGRKLAETTFSKEVTNEQLLKYFR